MGCNASLVTTPQNVGSRSPHSRNKVHESTTNNIDEPSEDIDMTSPESASDSAKEGEYSPSRAVKIGMVIRIAAIGKTGVGKSSTLNTLTGTFDVEAFETSGAFSSATKLCKSETYLFPKQNRGIQIVDTPGLFDTHQSNDDILKEVDRFHECVAPGPHAILMILKSGRFGPEDQETVDVLRERYGDEFFEHMIVVFTHCTKRMTEATVMEGVQKVPKLNNLLTKCDNRFVMINNEADDDNRRVQASNLITKCKDMITSKHGRAEYYTNQMMQAAADKYALSKEKLQELKEDHERIKEAGSLRLLEVKEIEKMKGNTVREVITEPPSGFWDDAAQRVETVGTGLGKIFSLPFVGLSKLFG